MQQRATRHHVLDGSSRIYSQCTAAALATSAAAALSEARGVLARTGEANSHPQLLPQRLTPVGVRAAPFPCSGSPYVSLDTCPLVLC